MLLQHPDGKTALILGDVDAWAGLDPMMALAVSIAWNLIVWMLRRRRKIAKIIQP